MRNLIFAALVSIFSVFSTLAIAAGPSSKLDTVDIDLTDKASLQRGAHTFVNYCLSCHGASLMRYNRMAKD
ncbi:MAG TPA: cytochrome c1, partial [Methylophaga sp.]|nr:cytochrome c1 [Methylophaga sp.]